MGEDERDPIEEVLEHYGRTGAEERRLHAGSGRLELERTKEIVTRHLIPPPASVIDVGGGPGVYTAWLLSAGYSVTLVDPVPLHVEQTRRAFSRMAVPGSARARVGDARRLEEGSESANAVLMLGPLYHLTSAEDRRAALSEALRVLRPGGLLFAAGISRFASLLDGLFRGYLEDPAFNEIVDRDLADGQHRNPTGNPAYFTTAYFHRPEELVREVADAGFDVVDLLAVEGPWWLTPDLDRVWNDLEKRRQMMTRLRTIEREQTLLAVSAHIIAVARKS